MHSRMNVLIVALVLIALVLYLAYIMHDAREAREERISMPQEVPAPIESVYTDRLFESDIRTEYETTPSNVDTATSAPEEPDENEDLAEEETEEGAATTTPLPTMRIEVDGVTQTGELGSYCWEGLCQTSIITDLPYEPIPVSASSTITFTIEAAEDPEQVFYFLKEVNGTNVVYQRELTESEVRSGTVQLEPIRGEHLLFLTGVWEGGADVASAFKIEII